MNYAEMHTATPQRSDDHVMSSSECRWPGATDETIPARALRTILHVAPALPEQFAISSASIRGKCLERTSSSARVGQPDRWLSALP
jgi:hypothetical protein